MLKSVITASVLSLSMAFSAQADINTSLQQVCDNAKQQSKVVLTSTNKASAKDFQSRLVNYYNGVSCQGKSLLHTSMKQSKKPVEDLVDTRRQDRF